MTRRILISGAVLGFLCCATLVILLLGTVVPVGFVDHGIDEYHGAKQRAVIHAVGEMYQTKQAGMNTYRVTTWRVTGVEQCPSRCPRAYAVEVDLYTTFGIPYGQTGVFCNA